MLAAHYIFDSEYDWPVTLARVVFVWTSFLLLGVLCHGQQAATEKRADRATLEIRFGDHAGFWGRYAAIEGPSKSAGWITSQNGKESFRIEGIAASATTRLKGIFYAPGCALQTLDLPIADVRLYRYSFPCESIPQVEILGVAANSLFVNSPNVTIEAKYVAHWAAAFFGFDDGSTTEIPLGTVATPYEPGRFRLSIPDLTKDSLAGSTNHAGEIRVWARDTSNGRVVAQLRLLSGDPWIQPTRLGGIPIERLGSSPFEFATCYANGSTPRDEFGFGIRALSENACVR